MYGANFDANCSFLWSANFVDQIVICSGSCINAVELLIFDQQSSPQKKKLSGIISNIGVVGRGVFIIARIYIYK